jgi:PhzF family phenazine biosynthesis protein
VDAFTDSPFKGNPAAVCLLEEENKDNQWLKSLAAEFNMPMTAYLTPIHGTSVPRFVLRYFTPASTEVYIYTLELNLPISYILSTIYYILIV